MAFVEKTGKSVDEAVAAALKELNITADQAVVEVLEEGKKGFLGFGRKDARVRVTAKASAFPEVEAKAEPQAAPVQEKTVSEATAEAVSAVKEAASVAASALAKKADEVKEAVAAEDFSKKVVAAKDDAVDTAINTLASLKSERAERSERPERGERFERQGRYERRERFDRSPREYREPRKYAVNDEAVNAAKERNLPSAW